jgi:hypothetical protein
VTAPAVDTAALAALAEQVAELQQQVAGLRERDARRRIAEDLMNEAMREAEHEARAVAGTRGRPGRRHLQLVRSAQ